MQDQIGSSSFNEKNDKKRRLKEKDGHCQQDAGTEGGKTLWKNFLSIFNKNNRKFEVFKIKAPQASSSFLKHPKNSTKLLNVANNSVEGDQELAMAIQLPAGIMVENVLVNIQLEVINKNEILQSFYDGNDSIVMKRCKESELLTVFTGVLKLPSNIDISSIVDMPLYLIDSNGELMLTPASELHCKKRIRPSEDMLLNEDNMPVMISDIRVTLQLSKTKKTRGSLLEVGEEIGRTIENITEDVFKKSEENVGRSNNVGGLLNREIEDTHKRDEQNDFIEKMQSYVDELSTEKVFRKYASLPKFSVTRNAKMKESLKNQVPVKKVEVEPWKDSSDLSSKRKGNAWFSQKLKELCKRLNLSLDENEMEAAIEEIWGSEVGRDLMHDTYTQYSSTNISNSMYNDECGWDSFFVGNSLFPNFKSSSTEPLTQRSSNSSESVLLSLLSANSNNSEVALTYKVPSNTPSSYTELRLKLQKSLSTTTENDEVEKITVTYKEKESAFNRANDVTLTIIDPHKFCNQFSPGNEIIFTQFKKGSTNDNKADKTLNLLHCARCKLVRYLQMQNFLKQDYTDLVDKKTLINVSGGLNHNAQEEKGICTACLGHRGKNSQCLEPNIVNSRLLGEFNYLQNEFVEMCENVKVLFNTTEIALPAVPDLSKNLVNGSGKIEMIEEDLTKTFSDLMSCLSTLGQTLEETLTIVDANDNQSELSSNRHQTYFAMESEIERTIQELLNESEGIKETIILSGGKKEAEPPFCCENINNTSNMCRKILTEILDSSNLEDLLKSDQALTDVDVIINVILDEVEKRNALMNKLKKLTVYKNENINLDAINCSNLQSGDIDGCDNCQVFSTTNNQVIYFQDSFNLDSKIPKTSFSFGQNHNTCVDITNSNCRTPVRHRDNSLTRGLETFRLFNELVNLQSGFQQLKKCDSELVVKEEGKSVVLPTLEDDCQDLLRNNVSCKLTNPPKIVLYNLVSFEEEIETEKEFIPADESPCPSCKEGVETNNTNESVKAVVDSSTQTGTSLRSSSSTDDEDCCYAKLNGKISACSCCNNVEELEHTFNEDHSIPQVAKKHILNPKTPESSPPAVPSSEYSNVCTRCKAFPNKIINEGFVKANEQDDLDVASSSLNAHSPIEQQIIFSEQTFISGVSTENSTTLQDQEKTQKLIPPLKHPFKSNQELNTAEEIAEIEENVKENLQLEKLE